MKKIIISAIFLSIHFLYANLALAADSHSDCGHFHLQISNLTNSTCVLITRKVIHGNLISAPPETIMPTDSKVFDMEQTGLGPNIMLSYQCGSESVSFISRQNFCFLEAGDVYGEVMQPLPPHITVSYTAFTGSYLWDKPGNINWKIIEEKSQSQ